MDLKTGTRHPWTLGEKLRRASWIAAWSLVRRGPRALSPLRIAVLRLYGARIGHTTLVHTGVKVLMPWNLQIGDHTAIGEGVEIYNYGQVTIGRNCVVSQRVWLCTGTHDYKRPDFPLIWFDITVGDAVWLAAECFVAPGVTIGDAVVVGARAVVTRDLEGGFIYAGNPCVLIKPRRRD